MTARRTSDWSREEVEATVADYFAMLAAELSGRPYVKAEHRRRLLSILHNRSPQAVEFKHANISAILIELGFPYISGYKPRSNYQGVLYEVVADRLAADQSLRDLVIADVDRSVAIPSIEDILDTLVEPPRAASPANQTAEPPITYPRPPVNYLEREARNRNLGLAGEEFVINFESARLIKADRESLAAKIEHISKIRGDGEGFDILSFETSGADRLIEVKTTKYGVDTPFFVSRNELRVSRSRAEHYHLYRVFGFRGRPQVFTLQGSLSSTCELTPNSYLANVAAR